MMFLCFCLISFHFYDKSYIWNCSNCSLFSTGHLSHFSLTLTSKFFSLGGCFFFPLIFDPVAYSLTPQTPGWICISIDLRITCEPLWLNVSDLSLAVCCLGTSFSADYPTWCFFFFFNKVSRTQEPSKIRGSFLRFPVLPGQATKQSKR